MRTASRARGLRRLALALAIAGSSPAFALQAGAPDAAAPKVESLDQGEHAPRQRITLRLAGPTVVVQYGRPALRGRSLEDLKRLLPAGRMWRMGANDVTTLTTDGEILIGEQRVPAGRYTLYVHIAETGPWSLVVNSDPGIPLDTLMPNRHPELGNPMYPRETYAQIADREVARVPLRRLEPPHPPAEFLEVVLAPARKGSSSIRLTWGEESWGTTLRAAERAARRR